MKYLLLLPLLLLFSCKKSNPLNMEEGTVYYFADYDKMDRMKLYDGSKTLFTCVLELNMPDTLKKTLQNGKNLYLIFKKPELLKKGASYKFPNPDIELLIAEWQSKDSFNLNPNVQGTISVTEHSEFRNTVLDIDIKLRTGLDEFKNYRFSKKFNCIRNYKIYKGDMPLPDSTEADFDSPNFNAVQLNGKWDRKALLFWDKDQNRWMEYFYLQEKMQWEINDGKMLSPKVQDFTVENGRIMMKDSVGSKLFIVNSFRNDSLLITNPLSPERSRFLFVKEKR